MDTVIPAPFDPLSPLGTGFAPHFALTGGASRASFEPESRGNPPENGGLDSRPFDRAPYFAPNGTASQGKQDRFRRNDRVRGNPANPSCRTESPPRLLDEGKSRGGKRP